MPEPLVQRIEHTAKLELDDGTRLVGDLSAMPGGKLQLAATRVLRYPGEGKQPALNIGALAKLLLEETQDGQVDKSASAVSLDNIDGSTLILSFTDAGAESARQLRSALGASYAASADGVDRTGYGAALEQLKRDSLSRLDKLFRPFLTELADQLFDLSTRVRHSSSEQNVFYDATVDMRRKRDSICADIIDQLNRFYKDPALLLTEPETAAQDTEDGDLNLVDTAEFESSLAIERMVNHGEDIYRAPMEALLIRYAMLIGADPNDIRLPVHIRPLSNAFKKTIASQGYAGPVLLEVFDFFDKTFIGGLESYYLQLNQGLARLGIRPDLEQEIAAKGTLLRKNIPQPKVRKTPTAAAAPPQEPAGHDTEQAAPGPTLADMARAVAGPQPGRPEMAGPQTPGPQPGGTQTAGPHPVHQAPAHYQQAKYDNIYKSVIDALNFKRSTDESSGGPARAYDDPPAGGGWDGAALAPGSEGQQHLASAHDIAQALGSLQHDPQARAAVEQGSSLREYLASNKQQLDALKDSSGLTADSLNQLDLVDNLFGTIRSQLDVSNELRPALGDLQIPLAKLALLDPRFFLERNHPARTTLDKLAQLSNSANFPNKALEGRISEIVDQIVSDYESDSAVFSDALGKIEKLVTQQERALTRNVERVVRIEEGQEKLLKAQQAVDKVIAAKVKTAHAPSVLVDLVDNGLRDLLVLTHIKEGTDSRGWNDHLKTLDQLGQWLSEHDQQDANDEMMTQRGLEAGTLIDMIEQQIASGLPTNVSHQKVLDELREIVSGDRDVEFINCTHPDEQAQPEPAQVRAKVEDLPRLRRWVMRVEQLEKGTWLAYRDKDGKKVRMQLAWISEERDRYIFVNERGQKVADISNIQLARQLSRGMQPPAPADKLSVVDKSLYQTLEHVQKTLSFARNHDALTKLINRATFLDQMGRALRHAQQKGSQHAVLYLNIDQFKLVNEVYDRIHGDQVLLEFARLLAQLHSKKSSSARIESDSFAVLLLDRTIEQSMQIAQKIRRDIEASSVDIEGEKIGFTVSIGVVPIRDYSPEVGKILNNARTTMHLAKEQGRNRVVQFQESQSSPSTYTQDKLQVKRELEQAVATDRFVLQAQPIRQTRIDGDVAEHLHYELLLGLTNKDGSLSSPQDFILSAERYGFMTLVDRWVVKEAFSWISELMDAQKVIPSLSINLSGSSVTDDSFMDYLFEQISEYGVGTSRICFEITETGTISNLVKAADFVRALRNIGCKFSIDDFGTGLASHNYLRELPVDYVKIDGSFVTNIHKNRNDYAIARSINDLAHFLGQETIAESVENDEIIGKLREIGVDFLQGWGIGRPKILSEVAHDLSSIEK